jgi:hypothetical protein
MIGLGGEIWALTLARMISSSSIPLSITIKSNLNVKKMGIIII